MMYVDDYGCVETNFIVHACVFDMPHEPDCPAPERNDFSIGLLLGLGKKGHRVALNYPTRQHRDAALERLLSLIRAEAVVHEEEDEL